jgi:hypothetical protein
MFSSRYPGTIVPAASDIASNLAVTQPIAKHVGSGPLCDSTQVNFPRDFDGSITPTMAMCESLRLALVLDYWHHPWHVCASCHPMRRRVPAIWGKIVHLVTAKRVRERR